MEQMSKEFKQAVKTYNAIMFSVCLEHATIGTNFSENTDGWNLRDLVSEMQYQLDMWTDPDCMSWQDAHDPIQPVDVINGRSRKRWLYEWSKSKARMERFINKYKPLIKGLTCTVGHCSIYD